MFTCTDIARQIAQRHKRTCAHTTVWRKARALKLKPVVTTAGGYAFYSPEQVRIIEAALITKK